jgi:stearoyl-CoA desaturase (delta-9 desaturase)
MASAPITRYTVDQCTALSSYFSSLFSAFPGQMFVSMLNGLVDLPWWGYIAVTLGLTHVTIASVTIYLHRHQAHRALDLHPLVSHFFRFWLWLTTGMNTKQWVAVHRKHHARVETPEDPHSPQVLGISKVLWQGTELYRQETKNAETLDKYGRNTPDDWIERNVYSRFHFSGLVLLAFIDLLLFGVVGITVWAVQMLWIPFWAAGVINGLGHYWGYRNYECRDASTNIVPWGIIVGGEELHNNHHTYPSSAKLSSKWWELDIGWLYIRVMAVLGLAGIKKVPPTPVIGEVKPAVDMDTLQAVLVNRFRVMSHYCKDVLLPVLRDHKERISGRALFRRARTLLVREESLLAEEERHILAALLRASERLRVVYDYKQRLQQIWKRSTVRQESLLHALQEWCRQAEATGIQALEDFARTLRGYTLKTA